MPRPDRLDIEPDARATLLLTVLVGAQFMISMDATIVNVALPSVSVGLGISQLDLGWVVNAYALAFGGLLLVGSRAGDRFGRRRMFLIGTAVFTLGSLACGVASNESILIAARALQGVGAAVMSPVAMSLILVAFNGRERHRALGLWSSMSGVAGSVGMLLGGLLAMLSWRWNFWVNIPAGLAILLLGRRVLVESQQPAAGPPDLLGALLGTSGIGLMVYGVVAAERVGWTSWQSGGLIVVAAILLGAFLAVQVRAADPLVPLTIFRNRHVAVGNAVTALVGGGGQVFYFVLTLYLQRVLGFSPLSSGLVFLPVGIGIAATSLPAARLIRALGIRTVLSGGLVFMIVGLSWLAQASTGTQYLTGIAVPTLIWGVGFGLAQSGAFIAGAQNVGPESAGVASGLIATTYRIGGAVGLAAMASLATFRSGTGGPPDQSALAAGYSWALLGAGAFAILGAALTFLLPSEHTFPTFRPHAATRGA